VPTLTIEVMPNEAAELASIQVDGVELVGNRIELDGGKKRVHVSVTAVGFKRYSQDVDVDGDKVLEVDLSQRPHKKNRTLAVTLGMGAIGLIAWLVRRR
jgi:hypothetical protein